jgi:4-amino-4-deoxy-L-arabinose transferase-like glycosyltransferase
MAVSILASVVVWGVCLALLIRILSSSGVPLPSNKVTAYVCADLQSHKEEQAGWKEVLWIFIGALIFRLVLYFISALPVMMFANWKEFTLDEYLKQWVQWDASNYIRIASGGYSYYTENGDFTTLAFFPLYAWLMRLVNLVIGRIEVSALLTSSLCYAGGCCFLYKLCCIDYGKKVAGKAVLFISIFPFALFFGSMMSESTFFLATAMSLYFIRKHNWMAVGVCGALAAMSRITGVLILLPAAVEFIEYYDFFGRLRRKEWKESWKLVYSKGLWLFLVFFGILVYLYCNYKTTGDWFKFLEYQQKYWGNHPVYFGEGLDVIVKQAAQNTLLTKAAIWIPQILVYIMAGMLMVYGTRRNRNMYTAYLIIYTIVNTSFSWPLSGGRYMSCAIPMFIFIADFTQRHPKAEQWITVLFSICFGIYLTGYLFSKQIM